MVDVNFPDLIDTKSRPLPQQSVARIVPRAIYNLLRFGTYGSDLSTTCANQPIRVLCRA